jgi:hypothetical protein
MHIPVDVKFSETAPNREGYTF